MSKTKYNWIELKKDYLRGNIEDVKYFLLEKIGVYQVSGQMKRKTAGWKEERKAYIEEAKLQALIIDQNKLAKGFKDYFTDIKNLKNIFYSKLIVKLEEDLSVLELCKIINMIKTDLGEPIRIVQNNLYNGKEQLVEDLRNALEH